MQCILLTHTNRQDLSALKLTTHTLHLHCIIFLLVYQQVCGTKVCLIEHRLIRKIQNSQWLKFRKISCKLLSMQSIGNFPLVSQSIQ